MGIDTVNNDATGAISLDPSKRGDADRQEIKRLAQQFEAMLMTQMLRQMRRSMLDDEEAKENGFGAEALTDTADVELGAALSRTGGIGLTESLLKVFERQITSIQEAGRAGAAGGAGLAGEAGRPGGAGRAGLAGEAGTSGITDQTRDVSNSAALLLTDVTTAASVSSKFGWRLDPLSGEKRFHQGVDIAVAYGHDVKAAANGIVSFAGVQNGYGNTVVIDHEGGRQTRYAHLSQEMVRAGDVVSEGQVLGKSGNSGRSTGPHLHFEMLVNGRPVDPVAAE
jgi:murein DD-endopeptidase MepM/ murein hydrolase activator NlpD